MSAVTSKLLPCALLSTLLVLFGAPGVGVRAWRSDPPARTDRFGAPLPKDALVRLGATRFRVEGTVSSVAFSPDGKWLAAGDSDGLVHLWEAATGKVIRQLDAGEDGPAVFFSHDGKALGARTAEGEVRLWDIASGKRQTSFHLQGSFQRRGTWHYHEQILVSPDRTRLIVVGDGNELIVVRSGKHADSYVVGEKLLDLSIELLELPSGKVVKQFARRQAPCRRDSSLQSATQASPAARRDDRRSSA
jgi:WD40 repeat protein